MEKHILSKSTFIKGHQCLKALYLHKKRPFLRDKLSSEQRAKFKRGHEVGALAQALFPGGIDVSPKSPSQYQKSVIRTQELIAAGQQVIYEATFQFNKVLVMLDILVKTETGWEGYEVKSSRALSKTYFTDAALQYYVITNSGLPLDSFYLVYVNEDYQLQDEGKIDIDTYFIKQEVSAEVGQRQAQIKEEIEKELAVLTEAHSPKIEVGSHCFSPYACDFLGFCWKNKPTDLFKIPALSKEQQTQMLDKGMLRLEELSEQEWDNELVLKQIESIKAEQPFVTSELKNTLSALPEDTVFMSYLSRQPAIPVCVGAKPYQHQLLAYAFWANGTLESDLFLGSCDTYSLFVTRAIERLSEAPTVVVFDSTDLRSVLQQTAENYPSFADAVKHIEEKIVGIKQWIEEGQFFYPGLKHDLPFKSVVKQVLRKTAFAKQTITADVLATNLYKELEAENVLIRQDISDTEPLLRYVQQGAEYVRQICESLSRA